MAAKTGSTSLPKNFDPDISYRVQLNKAVRFAGQTLSPGRQQTLTGAIAEMFRDSIESAEAVSDGVGDQEAT